MPSDDQMSLQKVNEMALHQEKLGKKLSQILSNMKKDSPSRKTESYIHQKKLDIDNIFQEATAIDKQLQKEETPSHPYFKLKYMEQIQEIYNEAVAYLKKCNENLPTAGNLTDNQEPIEQQSNTEQNKRIRRQNVRIQMLVRTLEEAERDLSEPRPSIRYESLIQTATTQWTSVMQLHEEIEAEATETCHPYFQENVFWTTQEKYREMVNRLEDRVTRSSTSSKPNVPLPKTHLPQFKGGYEEWVTFNDLFRQVIHENTNLSNVERMQYLKTNVKGEAAKLIQHLQITEANYQAAWDLLQKRYQNTRLIVSKLIDRIIDLPMVQKESARQIRQLYDNTNECLQGLENLGIDIKQWDPIIGRMIIRKWDFETNRIFEQSIGNPNEVPSLSEIMTFLKKRFQSLETTKFYKDKETGTTSYNRNPRPGFQSLETTKFYNDKETGTTSYNRNTRPWNTQSCIICNQPHGIFKCTVFMGKTIEERNKMVHEKDICIKCIRHYNKEQCYTQKKCHICGQSHHTLLHVEKREEKNPRKTNSHTGTTEKPHDSVSCKGLEDTVLLATALIKVKSASGTLEYLRVLIDSGSQAALLTERAAQLLGLPRQKTTTEVSGLGDNNAKVSRSKIQCQIIPRFPSTYALNVSFIVLPKLTTTLPCRDVKHDIPESWHNQMLADPLYNKAGPIDGILGAEELTHILEGGLKRTKSGLLGQETKIGWILSGNITSSQHEETQVISMVSRMKEDRQLTKFWEVEEAAPEAPVLSQENQECEKHYEETTTRESTGKYTVRIPFKKNTVSLGNSRPMAMARYLQLEKKLGRNCNNNLKTQYHAFMQEYLTLGHMEKVPQEQIGKGIYYIPHQPVIREDSATTKLRVVFDASAKSNNGISLNENMHIGPRLQLELTDILLKWRKHAVVFCADVEKMYRQIQLDTEDRDYHRILWRFSDNIPIEEYRLTTVTYGTASAPYLAVKTLQRLALDEKSNYPEASNVVMQDFYVDDLMTGAESIEKVKKLQSDVINLLKAGGMTLRKWSSNRQEILANLPEELRDQTITEISEDKVKKALGVCWCPQDDTFRFKVNRLKETEFTKRKVISEVAKLFDPVGWLAPVVVSAKILIQELWAREIKWDDPLPVDLHQNWLRLYSNLEKVEEVRIPRWIHTASENGNLELHGFCDASEKAYGAVIYARSMNENGHVSIDLLTAKSKVAPIKTKISLPRLELCAAVLLSKVMDRTKRALAISNVKEFAWSDSMITLAWIKGDPSRWKTFVANRVSEITSKIPGEQWGHVGTSDNPADAISRGICPSKIKDITLWWNGPTWLPNKAHWPKNNSSPQTQLEEKRCVQVTINLTQDSSLYDRFSSFSRMVRVLSQCRRFIKSAAGQKRTGPLTTDELHWTTLQIIKMVQESKFSNEVTALSCKKQIQKNSRLLTLKPFLDENGVLRVGGRLSNSELPFEQKHPAILPNNDHVTKLIIKQAHEQTLHGGNQLTLAHIRQKYWIPNGRKNVRNLIHKCAKCIRYKAQTAQQIMGNLPGPRVTPSQPFCHTGVDYAGPISIRTTKGRGHKSYKGYIALFVCFATKGIHLEAVSDMTTEAFLAAFRRFTSRRGQVSVMYSDNGTNFVGASNVLKDEITKTVTNDKLIDKLATLGTQWKFIPPATPHMGGLWEAGVKSMKYHLKRVLGNSTLTFEELTTLLYQIEACLNSRPLCPLSNDTDDVEVITPGHFLIGRNLLAPGPPEMLDVGTTMSNRRITQKIKKRSLERMDTRVPK